MVGSIGASSTATVVGDVIVVGSAHHVGARPPSMVNTPGDVRGYNATTGDLLWTFHTIPEPGELGVDTWENDSWSYTGNAAVWAQISYDSETGFVYLPTEAPTGDYYGGHRHGNNLFSTSIVCLDSKTGERVWHFQTIHHDIWDWDNPSAPILADLVIDGVERKIVVLITKQGFVFVFDRLTGDPIWPIEERPVPQTDTPGEWTSPTQPFPTKPAPFDRQGFSEDDLIDFTPEIRVRAAEVASQYRMGPIYAPPSLADHPDGTKGMLSMPTSTGGSNWEGGALDPETGHLYIGSYTRATVLGLVEGGDRSDMNYIRGGGGAQVAPGVSIVKPPWGRITAIDLTTGEHAWMIANGDTRPRIAQALGLDLADLPRTGKPSRAGLLVTRTLLFAGEGISGDPVFRAHDKATGMILAEIEIPSTQVGLPMSYMYEGKQYVVVAVGGRGRPAEIIALSLPD
jgi:quinoprotein glucose dehydrogenase